MGVYLPYFLYGKLRFLVQAYTLFSLCCMVLPPWGLEQRDLLQILEHS